MTTERMLDEHISNDRSGKVMVVGKPKSGIFSRRSSRSGWGSGSQSDSVFGKAGDTSNYSRNKGLASTRKAGTSADKSRKSSKKRQGKNRSNSGQIG